MKHWIKDALGAAMAVRAVRKAGNNQKLALVEEAELIENREWLAKRDYENQLMQRVIIGTVNYESICLHCEERNECNREQKDKRGCAGWWLRFLTEEEEAACLDRAHAPGVLREHVNEDEGEALPPQEEKEE